MPRKPRLLVDHGYYHLIARGNNRICLFEPPYGCETLKSLLEESKSKFQWKLFHYCIMPNHLHLLAQINTGRDMPRLMQFLLFEYSRWYRRKTNYVGHLWQGRYKSPWIEEESYFLECGRYIERNPVRAGLVQRNEDYKWSSYGYYAQGQKDTLIDEDPYYQKLGQNEFERQERYRSFVKIPGPYESIMDLELLETHF